MRASLLLSGLPPAVVLVLMIATQGCKTTPTRGSVPTASVAPISSSSASPAVPRQKPARSTGSALARSADGHALYLADEDGVVVRRVALPLAPGDQGTSREVGGPPAQIIARDGEILVTVRDPGALVVLADDTDAGGAMRELARIQLPADAWGMALSQDETTLVVTSAWTHTVSVVDLQKREVVARIDVAREPRGVVFAPDGKKAWVTHLIGSAISRIDLAGATSKATIVALPAGTVRAPRGSEPSASLAYAPVISDDGSRLYVPRHALGTVSPDPGVGGWSGDPAWWGTSTVDMLLLQTETPVAPPRARVAMIGLYGGIQGIPKTSPPPEVGTLPPSDPATFIQPRDAILRRTTGSLLVVSEGTDSVTEHDPLAIDPALVAAVEYVLGTGYNTGKTKAPTADVGSAPTGIALSPDETQAYVWARGSREISAVPLVNPWGRGRFDTQVKAERMTAGPFPEPLGKEAAAGRKLFFLAKSEVMSGGLACAGCHPDGRDDGFVWRETKRAAVTPPDPSADVAVFVAVPAAIFTPEDDGKPRQTPMLAGRVASTGPFGWHGQNKDLESRLLDGFSLHRWRAESRAPTAYEKAFRLAQLKAFLRQGLRPPPRDTSALSPQEERGRAVFEDEKTMCKTCHPAETEFTTRLPVALKSPLPRRNGFGPEENQTFKIPSLLFVGGTPPYYHDGSVKTLAELVDGNGNRMGSTGQLSPDDRAALVAYLGRL